jgi:1,4-dihydroxy-6-naphthoate synthase
MPSPKLTLGFSPCPNDTFMFDAMVHQKIDTEGLQFDAVIEDVETLNRLALKGELDVTKISFAAFTKATDKYILLASGSALGNGVGPLLIAGTSYFNPQTLNNKIAIPGANTTANFLFSFFFPEANNKVEMVFSEIEDAVLSGKVDAGVIIHENRFTYEQRGLKRVCDLGDMWERETGRPIPLGGIAARRNLPEEIQQLLNRIMKHSVEFAFSNPDSSREFVKHNSREMDEEVRRKHIALYVNDYSISLGERGREAIKVFFTKAKGAGFIDVIPENIFVSRPAEVSVKK